MSGGVRRSDGWLSRARVVLLLSLALLWLNFLLTSRWAAVPGALHGPKKPVVAVVLVVVTLLACLTRRLGPVAFGREARVAAALGLAAIVAFFLVWFPPASWSQIPLSDNWPARFQSTVERLALLSQGTLVGWQWDYLGGYPLSTDLTVALTVPALGPMFLFGDRIGFHVAHLLFFLLVPFLVWWDFRIEAQRTDPPGEAAAHLPWLAFALTSVATLGYSYAFLRSGDTNSLAGVGATLVALVGSHLAAAGRRWGGLLLTSGLTLIVYSHAAFLVYAAILLAAEGAFYRDTKRWRRAAWALAAATVAGLPLTWESFVWPDYFIFNNVVFDVEQPSGWMDRLRQVYYNIEMLALPGRWLNDFTGLTMVCLPIIAFVARARGTRAGFYACATLVVVLMTRLNMPEFGYAFVRPIYLMGALTPPVIAAFLIHHAGSRKLAAALCVLVAVYMQVLVRPVAHTPGVGAYQPELVDRLRSLDGALVLVENTFHRDMVAGPGESEPTPFPSHFQSLLAAETGKRLYAGVWDGWQWSPYRGQLVAGGAWMGRALADWPREQFFAEIRRWGIRHLLVIHQSTRAYVAGPDLVRHPDAGPYAHFEWMDADTRAVETTTGSADLLSRHALGAVVELRDVTAGSPVVVRTNYYPAWTARSGSREVPLFTEKGQLAFVAPADGSYAVTLTYPRRSWLLLVALAAILLGAEAVRRVA